MLWGTYSRTKANDPPTPMDLQRENIQLSKGETFRLLRWQHTVREVEVVLGPGKAVPLHGEGDHWHYHPACELTFISRGAGTRLVADHIELFESGDLVLIGSNVAALLAVARETRPVSRSNGTSRSSTGSGASMKPPRCGTSSTRRCAASRSAGSPPMSSASR
jgi:predicted RNA-binding Zn-ribbon protein involved in translation (DUF1610 family)